MRPARITYSKCHPLPAYTGPQPVYLATCRWASGALCYVRKNGKVWETAPYPPRLNGQTVFTASPLGWVNRLRGESVMAFDYHQARGEQIDGSCTACFG